MAIENTKTEVLKLAKIFFDSIESQLTYREKHHSKFRALNSIISASAIMLVFSIIPLIPGIIGDIKNVSKTKIQISSISLDLGNFYIRWILIAFISFIIFYILFYIGKFFSAQEDKFSIKNKHLNFAYLYKSIKELEVYLVNDRKEHTINSIFFLKRYFKYNFLNQALELRGEIEDIFLPETLFKIQKEKSWINFSEETILIIKAFNDIDSKIYERIIQQKEIDDVINVLNDLLIFEYILLDKVKFENLNLEDVDKTSLLNKLLVDSASNLTSLTKVDKFNNSTEKNSMNEKIIFMSNYFSNLFTHQNLLITFFSWTILLSVILIILLYLGRNLYSLSIDSTIFIGAISAVLFGAITISATIYSKKK